MELNINGVIIRCYKNGIIERFFSRQNKSGYWYSTNSISTLISINKRNYKKSHLIYKAYNPSFDFNGYIYHHNNISTDNRLENLYFVLRNPERLNGRFS